jgi:hypothetical protein
MKSLSKFKFVLVILGIIYVVSTGIILQGYAGIEDGIIRNSFSNNGFFETVEQARNITLGINLVGFLIIAFLWCISLQKNNEKNL